MVRAPNGAQYIIQQPQQQILLQQQMQPGGVQAPVIQQVPHFTQKQGQAFVITAFWNVAVGPLVLKWENQRIIKKNIYILYMTFISVGFGYNKRHLK